MSYLAARRRSPQGHWCERRLYHLTDAHLGQIFLKHFQVPMQVYVVITVMAKWRWLLASYASFILAIP